ncbi:MAG: hypothetical protein J6O49_11545 [Bacteroidaceae bacterium]|nr:hypothetical protein [Bacteroidaceae bacterium]
MKYILTRYENGREIIVTHGDCTLDSMKKTVENSPEFFKDGYVIYELNVVEYGLENKV